MHIQININVDVEINHLVDLPKLKLLLESSNMKVNQSQLAREFGVDRRTIKKGLMGTNQRKRGIVVLKSMNTMTKLQHYYPRIQYKNFITKGYCGNI